MCLPSGGRSSRFDNTPLSRWSLMSGGFRRCSAAGHRLNAASPPTNTEPQGIYSSRQQCALRDKLFCKTTPCFCSFDGKKRGEDKRREEHFCKQFWTPSLTGIFNRKSSWLKRKPRSVLEDGLGVLLSKPVGRSTKTKCRLPGNEVWKRKKCIIIPFSSTLQYY